MRRLNRIAQILKVNAGCAPGHKKSVDGVGGVSWVEKLIDCAYSSHLSASSIMQERHQSLRLFSSNNMSSLLNRYLDMI